MCVHTTYNTHFNFLMFLMHGINHKLENFSKNQELALSNYGKNAH